MQDFVRIAELLNANPFVLECILHTLRRMGEVSNGNHHWRRFDVSFLPCLRCLQPVLPQEVVALADEMVIKCGAKIVDNFSNDNRRERWNFAKQSLTRKRKVS